MRLIYYLSILFLGFIACGKPFSDKIIDQVKENQAKYTALTTDNFQGVFIFQVYPKDTFIEGEQTFYFKSDFNLEKDSVSQYNVLFLDSKTKEVYYRPHAVKELYKKDDNGTGDGDFDFNLFHPECPKEIDIQERGKKLYLHDMYGYWEPTNYNGCDLKLSLQVSGEKGSDFVYWYLKKMDDGKLHLKFINSGRSIYPAVRFYGKDRRLYNVDEVFSFPIIFTRDPNLNVTLSGGIVPSKSSE